LGPEAERTRFRQETAPARRRRHRQVRAASRNHLAAATRFCAGIPVFARTCVRLYSPSLRCRIARGVTMVLTARPGAREKLTRLKSPLSTPNLKRGFEREVGRSVARTIVERLTACHLSPVRRPLSPRMKQGISACSFPDMDLFGLRVFSVPNLGEKVVTALEARNPCAMGMWESTDSKQLPCFFLIAGKACSETGVRTGMYARPH
jgi:hypothetical protein